MTNMRPTGKYAFLDTEPGPLMLKRALELYGTTETPGAGNTETILGWAAEMGGWVANWYDKDSIPWCGLFMAVVAKRAGKSVPKNYLTALAWSEWGSPSPRPALGDVLTFGRKGGGHVGLYVGEDAQAYHVLGGNQSDQVNVMRLNKSRFVAARRQYRIGVPRNVRPINIKASGTVSENER